MKKFRKGKGEKPSFLKRGGGELDDEAFPVIAEAEKESGGGKVAQKRSGPKDKSRKRQQKVTFPLGSGVFELQSLSTRYL